MCGLRKYVMYHFFCVNESVNSSVYSLFAECLDQLNHRASCIISLLLFLYLL